MWLIRVVLLFLTITLTLFPANAEDYIIEVSRPLLFTILSVIEFVCVFVHKYLLSQQSTLTFRFNKIPNLLEIKNNFYYSLYFYCTFNVKEYFPLCCNILVLTESLCFLSLEWAKTGYIGADMNKPKPYINNYQFDVAVL